MNVGETLVALRKKHDFSQAKLSDLSGVPQTTISGIENEGKTPGLNVASKLAKALNVKIEDLINEKVS